MTLEMKPACEKCGTAPAYANEASICTYGFTVCSARSQAMDHTCLNWAGALVRRPRRRVPK
jgi:hypothetical protein